MRPVHPGVPRRAFVAGTCGAACVAALSGCATYEVGVSPAQAPAAPDTQGAPAPGGSAPLAGTSDIPVGGGTVFADRDVVVTQPAAGEFHAFSATCTHQGCTVGDVTGGTINCPCHGSKFAVEDGSVVEGPARKPLPERQITVTGEDILLA